MAFLKKKEKKENSSKVQKPSYLKKPLFKKRGNGFVSIDFDEQSLKFAVGDSSNGRIKVDKLFSYPVPDGIYKSGKISDMDVMATTIQNALKENNVGCKNVIGTMESMEIIKRNLTVPALGFEDTLNYIKYEIGEYLPIDISTYVMQYKEIARREEEDGQKLDIIIYAFPKEISQQYYETFTKAKLNPCILDVHSNTMEKLITTQYINGKKIEDSELVAVVSFDHNNTIITIIKNGKYDFSRILESNNYLRLELLAKNIASEEQVNNFLTRYRQESIFENIATAEEQELQRETIESLNTSISEINKILEYWYSRNPENRLDRIFLSGEFMNLKDIDLYFEGKLSIHTERIESIADVNDSLLKPDEDMAKYVNAISGLVRRG